MKRQAPYIVWVENRSFRHRSLKTAQRRADRAAQEGKHFIIATTALRHSVYSITRMTERLP